MTLDEKLIVWNEPIGTDQESRRFRYGYRSARAFGKEMAELSLQKKNPKFYDRYMASVLKRDRAEVFSRSRDFRQTYTKAENAELKGCTAAHALHVLETFNKGNVHVDRRLVERACRALCEIGYGKNPVVLRQVDATKDTAYAAQLRNLLDYGSAEETSLPWRGQVKDLANSSFSHWFLVPRFEGEKWGTSPENNYDLPE